MIKKYQLTEEEFKAIEEAIESVLGYCHSWNEKDIMECMQDSGHSVSMNVKTFLEALKSRFIIK